MVRIASDASTVRMAWGLGGPLEKGVYGFGGRCLFRGWHASVSGFRVWDLRLSVKDTSTSRNGFRKATRSDRLPPVEAGCALKRAKPKPYTCEKNTLIFRPSLEAIASYGTRAHYL